MGAVLCPVYRVDRTGSNSMLKRISLRCVGSGGVVDLPGYKEDTEVLVYGDQHGGDNQAFDWDTRVGDITSV